MCEDLDDAARAALAEAIRAGEPYTLDEAAVERMAADIEAAGHVPLGFVLTVSFGAFLLVLGIFAAIGGLALLLLG